MLGAQKRKDDFNDGIGEIKRSRYGMEDHQQSDDSEYETDDEEKDLEAFLFGDNQKVIFTENSNKNVEKIVETNELLSFTISTNPSASDEISNNNTKNIPIKIPISDNTVNPAAWYDDDDDELTIDILNNKKLRKLKKTNVETSLHGNTFQERLKTQFEKILPTPAWADIENSNAGVDAYSDDEDQLFSSAKKLTEKYSSLPKGNIDIARLKNLNEKRPSSSTITSLEFHPHSHIAFTTSMNQTLNIFQADGKENLKLKSVFLSKFPIYTGHFSTGGEKIYLSSRRKYFYFYDLQSAKTVEIAGIRGREEKSLEKFVLSPDGNIIAFLGSSGYIHLVSTKNYHLISSVKMNGKVLSATFSPDSSQLFSSGSDGEVYVWDVKSRACQHRFVDDGSLKTISLTMSSNSQYVVAGSSSGIVNVYDQHCLTEKRPKPVKVLKNLTTAVDKVNFNSTNELLCYSSPQVRNALKLVHFPSLTTYSNWPIVKQTLGNVSCSAFSPCSGYLGIGNENGSALLFRLNHYPDL